MEYGPTRRQAVAGHRFPTPALSWVSTLFRMTLLYCLFSVGRCVSIQAFGDLNEKLCYSVRFWIRLHKIDICHRMQYVPYSDASKEGGR